jgi:hypothetical protein
MNYSSCIFCNAPKRSLTTEKKLEDEASRDVLYLFILGRSPEGAHCSALYTTNAQLYIYVHKRAAMERDSLLLPIHKPI